MRKRIVYLLLALMSVTGVWAQDYLSFTAVGGNMTIGMTKTGSPDAYTIQWSADKQNWSDPQSLSASADIVSIPAGQTYYFRHGGETAVNRISSNDNNYWSFTMSGNGTIEAGGNIMYLLDATGQKTGMSSSPQHVFTKLFMNCEKLTKAPKLPATSLGQFCYVNMFAGTGITRIPELPATIIPDGAYSNMFENCKNLEGIPYLPGIVLSRRAYRCIFKGCEKLTSVKIAIITSMDSRTEDSHCPFYQWIDNTAVGTTGVLIAPSTMLDNVAINMHMPSNWVFEQYADDPTTLSFTFFGAGMPIENEHYLEGLEMTFANGGDDMVLHVNGAKVTYPLDNVGELYHTKFPPNVHLHANEDPDNEGKYYATFYSGLEAYSLPEGVKAYTAEISEYTVLLTPIEGEILPQGEAVLLYTTEGSEITMEVADGTGVDKSDNNKFSGVDVETEQDCPYYMLSYGQGGLGFYRMDEGMMLSANKAFLPATALAMANVRAFRMVFEDEETGIENINDDDTLRYDNDNIYSVSGIRLNKLQKGINIVNGKKVVIK